MKRSILYALLFYAPLLVVGQTYTVSLGLSTGITSTYTVDKGINSDPRFQEKYSINVAPVAINYGMDFENVGFVISPGLINIGQHFYVVNTSGGQDGLQKNNQQYFNLPVAGKFHIINLSFFRVSALAGVSVAYLTKGSAEISHEATKLKFAPEVYPILPPEYTILYDGVQAPRVDGYSMLDQHDFNKVQLFVLAGIRSDWDVSDDWQMSFDLRMHYGFQEPRNHTYINSLNTYQELYALPGKRNDTFVQVSIGVSRYVTFDRKDKDRRKTIKETTRKRSPGKNFRPGPRTNKPRH